jgi:predicted glycoside hydrolase/deacetylase ChbG (UPF0249 family)
MVFMEDSERAADCALEAGMLTGLHLNFCQPFTGKIRNKSLRASHERIVRFLKSSKYALLFYNHSLRTDFEDDYQGQLEEFHRLYHGSPAHFDGHQHKHLCTNVLMSGLIPHGARVRRNFTFQPGEKGILNRSYRRIVDAWLARRYCLTDFFFALSQNLDSARLARIATLARTGFVELMVHPVKPDERICLMSNSYWRLLGECMQGGSASKCCSDKTWSRNERSLARRVGKAN